MMLSASIRSWLEHPIQWVKTNRLLTFLWSLLVVLLAIFVAVMFSETVEKCVGQLWGSSKKNETLTFLGLSMGGILLVLQVLIANRRATAFENTVMNAERGLLQERLKNAIEHLGHASDSVRMGGAYELFHLAKDTKDLRQTVMDILYTHIRWTTGETEYQEKHPSKPSEEIQSLLTLLFVQEHEVFKGCRINLQGSWLNGAKLPRARLQGANLAGAHLQNAELQEARLQGARCERTRLQEAILDRARLHGADLTEAKLQGSELKKTQLYGANLVKANLQRADLSDAHLQGSILEFACLQGATLVSTRLQGAVLHDASLQGANLNHTLLQGIHYDDSGMSFAKHIKYWAHKESMVHTAVFAGGLSRQDVDALVEGLLNENAKKDLREKLKPHIDKPENRQLPENSHARTGVYTEKEAERWIAEYNEAMSEVPEESDS